MPAYVWQSTLIYLTGKEAVTLQARMALAERNHLFEEAEQIMILFHEMPIEPTDLIILAVGVVVSLLGTSDFIASHKHRDALGEQKNSCKILDLALAQCLNVRIVRLSFHTTIPAQIIIITIPIPFAIAFVVFIVV